jgi:hypothetical protein
LIICVRDFIDIDEGLTEVQGLGNFIFDTVIEEEVNLGETFHKLVLVFIPRHPENIEVLSIIS